MDIQLHGHAHHKVQESVSVNHALDWFLFFGRVSNLLCLRNFDDGMLCRVCISPGPMLKVASLLMMA